MNFEEICDNLNIEWKNYEAEFRERPWAAFDNALKKKLIKTWGYPEAFLAWLLVLKFKPRAVLELGSQHGHSGLIWLDAVKKINGLFVALELGNDPRNKYSEECMGTMQFLPDDAHVIKVWGDAVEELPLLLQTYPIDLVFHDCAHTWDHIENCLTTIKNFNGKIIQTCHDCAEGKWQPDRATRYGVICAERPLFDKYYLNNPDYFYAIMETKHGFGIAIPKEKL
jgi:predicted O-methyltransferase YrrM